MIDSLTQTTWIGEGTSVICAYELRGPRIAINNTPPGRIATATCLKDWKCCVSNDKL